MGGKDCAIEIQGALRKMFLGDTKPGNSIGQQSDSSK
jgi:hypothetical protein